MAKTTNIFDQIAQEATALLVQHVATPDRQLCLFEEFADANEKIKQTKPKTKDGLTWPQEVFCQLLARGYSKVEAYRLSHPKSKTENLNTIYPKASKLSKLDKIGARKDCIEHELKERALMSPTELFQRLTETARSTDKKTALEAQKLIGQIHGVFKPENQITLNQGPLVVEVSKYTPQKTAKKKKTNERNHPQ